MIVDLMCPNCYHILKVDEYDFGECPNCHEWEYYWTDNYYEDMNPEDFWKGFEWNIIKNKNKT
jgi:hypothetical protein